MSFLMMGVSGMAGSHVAENDSLDYTTEHAELEAALTNASEQAHANVSGHNDLVISATVDPIINMASFGLDVGYWGGYHIPYFDWVSPLVLLIAMLIAIAYKLRHLRKL
jgi:hypothetical protein